MLDAFPVKFLEDALQTWLHLPCYHGEVIEEIAEGGDFLLLVGEVVVRLLMLRARRIRSIWLHSSNNGRQDGRGNFHRLPGPDQGPRDVVNQPLLGFELVWVVKNIGQ